MGGPQSTPFLLKSPLGPVSPVGASLSSPTPHEEGGAEEASPGGGMGSRRVQGVLAEATSSKVSQSPQEMGVASPESPHGPQQSAQAHRAHRPGSHSCLLVRPKWSTDGRTGLILFLLRCLNPEPPVSVSHFSLPRKKHTSHQSSETTGPSFCCQASKSSLQRGPGSLCTGMALGQAAWLCRMAGRYCPR